jgi:two-component system NarL family sensor kinase
MIYLSNKELLLIVISAVFFSLAMTLSIVYLLYKQKDQKKKNNLRIYAAMIETQEKERERIAKDLHDHVCSILTGVKLQISFSENTNQVKKFINLERAKLDISKSIDEIRNIIHNLQSGEIAANGLIESLHSFTGRINLKNIYMKADIEEKNLSIDFQTNIYRICTELISNSLKYSNGLNIWLEINTVQNNLILKYSDDGRSNDHLNHGYGLQNIKNRVMLMNGRIDKFSIDFISGANYEFAFKTKSLPMKRDFLITN